MKNHVRITRSRRFVKKIFFSLTSAAAAACISVPAFAAEPALSGRPGIRQLEKKTSTGIRNSVNMKKVKLKLRSKSTYKHPKYTTDTYKIRFTIKGAGSHRFRTNTDPCKVKIIRSRKFKGSVTMVQRALKNKTLTIKVRVYGTAVIRFKVRINGKWFKTCKIRFKTTKASGSSSASSSSSSLSRSSSSTDKASYSLNQSSLLLSPGQSGTLSLKRTLSGSTGTYNGSAVWTSSNPTVASVNANGLVTARKTGNTIIYARVGSKRTGCVVSVTTPAKVSAIRKGYQIVQNCTYWSDSYHRMLDQYYDCSSLVWKCLHENICDFGDSEYAPTAAQQCSYLKSRGRLLGTFSNQNEQNLVYQAGDVSYNQNDGKHYSADGIYHTEIISGYDFTGFTSSGNPSVEIKTLKIKIKYGVASRILIGRP